MEKMKRLFSLTLVLTMGMGVVGCSNSNEGTQPSSKEDITEVNEDPKEEEIKIPTETMSVEETQQLTAGTVINFEDINKLPDEATLESMNLTAVYCIEMSMYDKDGILVDPGVETLYGVLPTELADDGIYDKPLNDGYVSQEHWVGVKISEIVAFNQNENGQWIKVVEENGYFMDGSPVVSEELLNELTASSN